MRSPQVRPSKSMSLFFVTPTCCPFIHEDETRWASEAGRATYGFSFSAQETTATMRAAQERGTMLFTLCLNLKSTAVCPSAGDTRSLDVTKRLRDPNQLAKLTPNIAARSADNAALNDSTRFSRPRRRSPLRPSHQQEVERRQAGDRRRQINRGNYPRTSSSRENRPTIRVARYSREQFGLCWQVV